MHRSINFWVKMVLILFSLVLLTIGHVVAQQDTVNYKRGYGFGQHMQEDMQALSVGTAWWYNWWHRPDAGNDIINVYRDFGMEFVPQAWNGSFNETAMREYLSSHPDVKYIMGFNEPNFRNQANMTPAQVAAQWKRIEAIADDFGLKIVAPALNYSPDAPYQNPFTWMDEWLVECEKVGGCRFDFVNVHCYMNTVSSLQWFLKQWKKYGKPIWLTEFCAWDGIETTATLQYQKNFMLEALPVLDNDPDIYRYAWFVGRSSGIPYNSLLTSSKGVLTDLGKIYTGQYEPTSSKTMTLRVIDETKGTVTNSAAWPDQSVYTWLGNTTTWAALNNMPAGTMSGNWIGMYNGLPGGKLEKTDEAWIWSYTFEPSAGLTYNWNPGIWVNAGRTENSLKSIHVNRNLRFTVSSSGQVSGEVTLRIKSATAAEVESADFTLSSFMTDNVSSYINIGPNPASGEVHIFSPWQINSVRIYNLAGMLVLSESGNGTIKTDKLPSGNYIMRIQTTGGIASRQLIISKEKMYNH